MILVKIGITNNVFYLSLLRSSILNRFLGKLEMTVLSTRGLWLYFSDRNSSDIGGASRHPTEKRMG